MKFLNLVSVIAATIACTGLMLSSQFALGANGRCQNLATQAGISAATSQLHGAELENAKLKVDHIEYGYEVQKREDRYDISVDTGLGAVYVFEVTTRDRWIGGCDVIKMKSLSVPSVSAKPLNIIPKSKCAEEAVRGAFWGEALRYDSRGLMSATISLKGIQYRYADSSLHDIYRVCLNVNSGTAELDVTVKSVGTTCRTVSWNVKK